MKNRKEIDRALKAVEAAVANVSDMLAEWIAELKQENTK